MPPSLPVRLAEAVIARLDGSATRLDTTTVHGTTSGLSGAGIMNVLSGIGGARDSGSTARPNTQRDYLSPDELTALMRGSVYRRIVELLPRWATVRGITITDSTDDEKPLAAAMRRIKLRDSIRRADIWGRALGESRILLVTDDMSRLDQPLDFKRVRKLHRLEVLDRREFTAETFEGDPSRGPLGEPVVYQVHPIRSSVGFHGRVHASRLLRFYGDPLAPSDMNLGTWGWGADAVGQTLWDGIRNLSQTTGAGAKLAQELSVGVFKLANGPSQKAGDERASAIGVLALLNLMKSTVNAVLIGKDDTYERQSANVSGYADLSDGARMELALLTGYPLALLFGEAPSGLSTDASSWITNWHANVGAWREERYRDPVETITELLYMTEAGGVPDEWSVEFPALGDMTEREKAEVRLLHTQADSAAIMDGVLTAEDARSRYTQPGGFVLDLQPVEDIRRLPGPVADPEVEASARKLIEAAAGGPAAPAAAAAPAKPAAAPTTDRLDSTPGAVWIGAVLPAAARAAWDAARVAVEGITGLLDSPGDDPHVTVLFMGQVDPAAVAEVIETARQVAERVQPTEAATEHAHAFAPGPNSDGRWPVVLDVCRAWGLWEVQQQLLPRLAHLITARQFPTYRAHATLGYAAALTPEQVTALAEIELPESEWMIGGVQVRYGAAVVATLPFAGRVDAAVAAK